MRHAERQIDQIRRRVIGGERIPHDEKVFSIFEEHTQWIRKGKAEVLQPGHPRRALRLYALGSLLLQQTIHDHLTEDGR